MSKTTLMAAVTLLAALGAPSAGWAQANVSTPSAPPPSPFETGISGFGMGIAAGLAGGYLVARENGLQRRDWRPVVAGAAIGALAGGALGLTLGFIDNGARPSGRGYLITRDMAYGGTFGTIFGALIGGLVALETNRPENILFGAAIGTLAGTGAGVVFGSLERNPWAKSGGTAPRAVGWNVTLAPSLTAKGTLAVGPRIAGAF
ncbi:MAG TPA: hypothetical protein VH374_15020 [Polyangia bacterium]|jgi:hypothetical protein|nr:hypothetical protein [Polyangia bacterium]